MTLENALTLSEDLMQNPDIPMAEYNLEILKHNGEHQVQIYRRDCTSCLQYMKHFSEVLNDNSTSWKVQIIRNILYIIAD